MTDGAGPASAAGLLHFRETRMTERVILVLSAAGAIAWLLSPEAAWVTGQVIGVDAGLASVRARR